MKKIPSIMLVANHDNRAEIMAVGEEDFSPFYPLSVPHSGNLKIETFGRLREARSNGMCVPTDYERQYADRSEIVGASVRHINRIRREL